MDVLSDREIEDSYLRTAANEFQWCVESSSVQDGWVSVAGWAITLQGRPEDTQFLANGIPFEKLEYPISSPDVGNIYSNIAGAQSARFVGNFRLTEDKNWRDGCL